MDMEFLTELGISDEHAGLIIEKSNSELNQMKIRHAVENRLTLKGVKSINAAMKLFDYEGLSIDGDEISGIDDKINTFISENEFLFENSQKPVFSAPAGQKSQKGITREEFSKMGYSKRLKLYKENPQMYMELSSGEGK